MPKIEQLNDLVFKDYSQIGSIIRQFEESAQKAGLSSDSDEIYEAKNIITSLRPAFRDYKENASGYNIWTDDKEDFLKEISSQSKEDQDKLKRQYDTIWHYYNIATILKVGEKNSQPVKDGLNPSVDDIEEVASRLLQLKHIYSRLLENLIVGSLIYCETVAFARTVVSDEKMFGTKVPTEIKGAGSGGFLETVGKATGQTLLYYFKESLKIGFTYAISSLLTGNEVTANWVITCSYTACRWYFAHKAAKTDIEVTTYQLLSKMCTLHTYFSKGVVNFPLLRDQLYKLEAEGARFSPMVYEVIDRVIARDSKV
jgi:hypothetical protein